MSKFDLALPPGMVSDDTRLASKGRYVDGSNVRFWESLPEVIGGWESIVATLLTGVCRAVFQWTDLTASLNIAFGTHSNLQLWQGGALYDITPTLALPALNLGTQITTGSNPIATVNLSTTVAVAQAGHPYVVGDSIVISGAAAVNTVTINGTWTVSAVTTNTWSFVAGSAANATGTGGGASVVVTPQRAYAAGQIDGTGGSGYSTGAYDVGLYGTPSATDYFPRTWAMAAWGQNLVASPRLGTIYQWTNGLGSPAQPVLNAPAKVRNMLVAGNDKDQLFALGCNQEVSGVYNPLCIRHTSVRNITEWNTTGATTAREYILTGGGEIVAGRECGNYLLIWTTNAIFLGTFVGSLDQIWRFDRIDKGAGLIGPNAVVVTGQRAVWMAPDQQFRSYTLGGAPIIVACPIRKDMTKNLAASQADKIMASSTSKFGEVRFDYPDARDGFENSRYLTVSLLDGNWYPGQMARTAMVDAGPSADPIGVTAAGNIYWHERGTSADGAAFSWFFETGEMYIDEAVTALVDCLWPDVSDQVGAWYLTLFSRLKPQGAYRQFGPVPILPGDEKIDFRLSGRLFRVRFSGNSTPTGGRLGRPIFNYKASAKR